MYYFKLLMRSQTCPDDNLSIIFFLKVATKEQFDAIKTVQSFGFCYESKRTVQQLGQVSLAQQVDNERVRVRERKGRGTFLSFLSCFFSSR